MEQSDLRSLFRSLAAKGFVNVRVTLHALSRLTERKARNYKKLGEKVVKDIIANTVRDGRYRIGRKDLRIATRSYTLACTIQESALVVKTVMRTNKEKWGTFAAKARPSPWKRIAVTLTLRRESRKKVKT